MAFVKPSAPQYKPEDDLKVPGQYYARCVYVRQGIPNAKYPNGKPLISIDFQIDDPNNPKLRGKRCSIVTTESIYRDPQSKKESHFLQHCRMMGAPSPERGVDPESFIDKWYFIRVEDFDGRCYVRAAMPAPTPMNGQMAAPRVEVPAAIPMEEPGTDVPF